MVTKWLLVLIFSGQTHSVSTLYATQEQCIEAAKRLEQVVMLAVCHPTKVKES